MPIDKIGPKDVLSTNLGSLKLFAVRVGWSSGCDDACITGNPAHQKR